MDIDGKPAESKRSAGSALVKRRRGFAAMAPEQRQQIAAMGGRAAQQRGIAYRFTEETGRQAGRLGGLAVSEDREHMATIGRRGGEQRSANLRSSHASLELPLDLSGPSPAVAGGTPASDARPSKLCWPRADDSAGCWQRAERFSSRSDPVARQASAVRRFPRTGL